MTPDDLLDAARDLMQRPSASLDGIWPRAAALLARRALEAAMAELWAADRQAAGLSAATMRSQELCLTAYLDPATASRITYLSRRPQPCLPLPPLRAGPHRRRTHQLARPGRPDRDQDPGRKRSVCYPDMIGCLPYAPGETGPGG